MKKRRLLEIFLLTLPLLDLLTSLNNRMVENFLSVGMIIKGLAIIIAYIYVFFLSASKFKKVSILYYSGIIIYIVGYFLFKSDLLNLNFLVSELKYILKFIYFPVLTFALLNIFDESGFEKDKLDKIMLWNLIFYILIIIIPTILDINFKSYSNSSYAGSVGWYFSANEVSSILLLLFPFIYVLLKKHKVIFSLLFITSLFTISLIGTKVTLFGIIIITFLIFITIIVKKKKILNNIVIISFSAFLITIIYMSENYSVMNLKNSISVEETQETIEIENEISKYYEKNKFLSSIKNLGSILLSDRDVYALNSYYIYSENYRPSYLLFGMGFSNTDRISNSRVEKLIEIDFLDIFFHLGLLAIFIVAFPFIYTFIIYLKKRKSETIKFNTNIFFYLMIIFLTLGISSTAGHTYLAPAVSIYISIYFIYLLNEIKSFEKRKINDSKITILGLHLGYGGVENAISNIANMLEEKYEVEVISLYRKKEEPFKFNKRVKIKHLMNITSNKNEFKKALKNKQGLKILKEGIKSIYILLNKNYLLKKAIINSDSKIIISTRYSFSKILNKYGRDKTIKIHQEHTYNVNLQYIKKLNYLQNINYIMPVSKSILLKYKDKITINMKYIPLTLDYYPNKSEISDLNNNNLISIGRLENEKAMDELIYIMNGLTKNNKNVLLNIYGDGSNHQKLESLINEFKLEKNIKLWGFKPKKEIQDALKQSTLYLMTSKEESFGLVLIEAMSFGVPCIAYSSAEGAKEIIKPNTGYLIDNRDRKEYINQIENYLKYSIREKQEMGRNARKNINTYKFDTVKREWIKFINNIIKN
ncbi:putative uncharacterized protein [Mycoplasma sp. CAG:776]|nr:putative uncharacterized protein [Mycoplasma sp. CAG:776]